MATQRARLSLVRGSKKAQGPNHRKGQAEASTRLRESIAATPAPEPVFLRDSYASTAFAELIDRSVQAATARFTAGLSPMTLVGAYMDWASHIAYAPGKQLQLTEKAFRKWLRFAQYAARRVVEQQRCEPSIEPLPQDRRFVADAWRELPFDLFLGVPKHRAPDVVVASGMTEDGYVPVDPKTLQTRFPGVYAVGDVATIGVPKAGVFSEGAARVVAAALIATLRGDEQPSPYDGLGSCYIEFGGGRVGRVDVDFLSGPKPTGTFNEPSGALVAEKRHFGSSRRARWFNRPG